METRSKRRRLMSISSNVSSWPDLPARFESLNDDTLTTVLEFLGDKSYRSFGGLNYHCKEIYITSGMKKETYFYGYAPLSVIIERYDRTSYAAPVAVALSKGVVLYNRRDIFDWALEERKRDVLKGICDAAAKEGRMDLLDEVWNNIDHEGYKRAIFGFVDQCAASGGRLNVLKWIETRGLSIDEQKSAKEAAKYGQLHILQWLQEEKGFQLNRGLYYYALRGGHLNVMKWLREKKVRWYESTFKYAAQKGNLDVLQWLHDEGCPWPEDDFVYDSLLKPEALDWCRVKGYGDRII